MSNKNINDNEQDFEQFSIKEFLLLCLGYWKWFLVSLIVFVGLGLFYIFTRQPVYERSEEILVKNQEGGGGIGDIAGAFSSLGLFSSNTKVYNELIAFQSPAVMFEVVDRLNLTENFLERDGLTRTTLYGTNQPVRIEFPDLPKSENVGFRITIRPDGSYELSKMYRLINDKKVKYKEKVSGKIGGGAVQAPWGPVVVTLNDAFTGTLTADGKDKRVIDFFRQSRQGAVEKYCEKLKGDLADQDADVIKLSIEDNSIQRADDILNMVVIVYNERWIDDSNQVAKATSKFINERLVLIGNELEEVDSEIANKKGSMQVPDLEEAARGFMAQDFKMTDELLQVTNRLAMSKYLKEYLQDPANAYSILPFNTGTENITLERQIEAYNNLLLERNNLVANSGEQNPLVKDRNKQLAGLRNAIVSSIDTHIANLQNALANITQEQKATKSKLGSSPQMAKDLLSVERQQLVMQELYLFLLQKREENELSQAFTNDNTRIITPPYGLSRPIAPKKKILLAIFIILGVAIPATALFIADAMNTKIRSRKDIENLPLPFAGEIPHIGRDTRWLSIFKTKKMKQKATDKPKIIVAEGKRDISNEAFRVVRSNIDFMLGKNEHPIIALTSLNPGSGKSFIAFNLGASFALKHKKVLLIDGDLRHGSISKYVDSPRKGLTTYLTGSADDWHQLTVRAAGFDDLYVLPIGNRPPNPAELLDNGRIATLLEEAKGEYDIVMIDCPPVNVVVDTQIINEYATRTLFVIRAGLLERKAVSDISALVERKTLKNVTLLLNGTKSEHSTYHSYGNYEAIDNV